MLHLIREPVGVYFANTATVCDVDANPEKCNGVVLLLMKASEGKVDFRLNIRAFTQSHNHPLLIDKVDIVKG